MLRSLLALTMLATLATHAFAQEAAEDKVVKLKPGDTAPTFQGKPTRTSSGKAKTTLARKFSSSTSTRRI